MVFPKKLQFHLFGKPSIVESCFPGILLPELICSLILLETEVPMFLTSVNWLSVFGEVLKSLDKLCRLSPDVDSSDVDDISWRGVTQTKQSHYTHKPYDDLPLIRKADLDNHNMDGGLWVLINNKVYDVQDFRCDNSSITELLQKYAGKDATQFFNSSAYHLSVLQMMENYVVGNYCQPEPEFPQSSADSLHVYSTLFDTERNLGYLLGLHAFNLRQSLPLQSEESASSQWLNARFLRAGLQVEYFKFYCCVETITLALEFHLT